MYVIPCQPWCTELFKCQTKWTACSSILIRKLSDSTQHPTHSGFRPWVLLSSLRIDIITTGTPFPGFDFTFDGVITFYWNSSPLSLLFATLLSKTFQVLLLFDFRLRELDAELSSVDGSFLVVQQKNWKGKELLTTNLFRQYVFELWHWQYFIVRISSLHQVPFLSPIGWAFTISTTHLLSLNSTHPSIFFVSSS